MKFNTFFMNILELDSKLDKQGLKPEDVDVVFTKSSGENLLCLVRDNEVITYFKWGQEK